MAAPPPARVRLQWHRVDGVLLLDKPVGLSSNTALQRARRLLLAEKAGHTGTLDPLASGLLPLCFGEATKFAQTLLDAPKRYSATIRFGASTTTGDAEGEVVARGPEHVDRSALEQVLGAFVGPRTQVPPRYAALKHEGRAYYDYARAGIEIPREPRAVHLHAIALRSLEGALAVIDVECSKGTYVRVLAEEIGAALGTCAHLAALRRTGTGGFRVEDAVTLEALQDLDPAARERRLMPVDALVAALPRLDLSGEQAAAVRHGRPIPCAGAPCVRAYDPAGRLIGVLERDGGWLKARRLLRTDN